MAGTTIRVLEKTTFAFTGTSQIAVNKTVTLPVAVNVDLSQYTWAGIMLRVHSFTVGASGGTGTNPGITAQLWNSAPTPEDPGLVFRAGAAAIAGTAVPGTSGSTVGPVLQVNMTSAAGLTASFGDVLLVVSQWTATAAADLTLTVSIDLVLKS